MSTSRGRGPAGSRSRKSEFILTSRSRINSACRFRSSVRLSNSMREISLVKSSESAERTLFAIDRRLGRTVFWATGDDSDELGVASLDGGEGDRYDRCIGGSLYCASPSVRSGYNVLDEDEDEGVRDEGVSFAGGPRYMGGVSFGSTGTGRDWLPGTDFNCTIVRIDFGIYSGRARCGTAGTPLELWR